MKFKFLGAKKKFLGVLFIVTAILVVGWFTFVREAEIVCANSELVRTIIQMAENATYEIIKVKPLEKKLKFCKYVLKKRDVDEYIIVFTDRDLEYVFIGDILDVQSGRFIGFEELVNLQINTNLRKEGKEDGTS